MLGILYRTGGGRQPPQVASPVFAGTSIRCLFDPIHSTTAFRQYSASSRRASFPSLSYENGAVSSSSSSPSSISRQLAASTLCPALCAPRSPPADRKGQLSVRLQGQLSARRVGELSAPDPSQLSASRWGQLSAGRLSARRADELSSCSGLLVGASARRRPAARRRAAKRNSKDTEFDSSWGVVAECAAASSLNEGTAALKEGEAPAGLLADRYDETKACLIEEAAAKRSQMNHGAASVEVFATLLGVKVFCQHFFLP